MHLTLNAKIQREKFYTHFLSTSLLFFLFSFLQLKNIKWCLSCTLKFLKRFTYDQKITCIQRVGAVLDLSDWLQQVTCRIRSVISLMGHLKKSLRTGLTNLTDQIRVKPALLASLLNTMLKRDGMYRQCFFIASSIYL